VVGFGDDARGRLGSWLQVTMQGMRLGAIVQFKRRQYGMQARESANRFSLCFDVPWIDLNHAYHVSGRGLDLLFSGLN
jgi:hypothetical protein